MGHNLHNTEFNPSAFQLVFVSRVQYLKKSSNNPNQVNKNKILKKNIVHHWDKFAIFKCREWFLASSSNKIWFCISEEKREPKQDPKPKTETIQIKTKYNKAQIHSAQFHWRKNMQLSSFYLSFEVSFSMSSWSGASSLLSIRLNSWTKKIKCLKDVLRCASSWSWITGSKCWWYMWA